MSSVILPVTSALTYHPEYGIPGDFSVTNNEKFIKLSEILFEELNKLNLPNTVVKRTYNPYSHVSDLEIKIINPDIDGNKNGELEAFAFELNLDALRQSMLIRYGIEREPGFGKSRNLGLIVCPYPLKAFKIKDYFNEFISKATSEIDQWASVVYMRTDHY